MIQASEWLLVGGLIALPFLFFLLIELVQISRRRRERAVAQRRKGVPRR